MNTNITGRCLCEAVTYKLVDPVLARVDNCHCSRCRRTSGAAFGSYAIVESGRFSWSSGAGLVTKFESSPNTYRCFCSVCGSPLAAFNGAELRGITLGTVDGDPGCRPAQHIFVDSKAPWFDITDDLPQFEGMPPHHSKPR